MFRILFTRCMLLACCCVCALPCAAQDYRFSDPQPITDHSENYRMSRNPNTQAAFDSSGTLHLTYWAGFFATNPSSPAAVYYRNWNEATGWSDEQIVDDFYFENGDRMGGRHPSLAVDSADTVWIAWHDHRNSLVPPPYNGINDIEIYCDRKPAGEEFFSTEDIRLTNTTQQINDNLGDNGYCARIRIAPDNKASVMWYDFHSDGWGSDIFMLTSDAAGDFDISADIMTNRLTAYETRDPIPPDTLEPAFNMPDFVITPQGQRYAIWTQDFGGSTGNSGAAPIYFAAPGETASIIPYIRIAPGNDGYWYPPKLKLAPNGDLWVVYTVLDQNFNRRIAMLRRPYGASGFDPVIEFSSSQNESCNNADIAFDSQGRMHVVWIKDFGFENHQLWYCAFDPAAGQRSGERQLSAENGPWEAPIILFDAHDNAHVICGSLGGDSVGDKGDIWFTRGEPVTAAAQWALYE